MNKRKVVLVAALFLLFIVAALIAWPWEWTFAGDVPALSAQEIPESPEAHWVWLMLAGEGVLGALFIGLATLLYTIVRPYIQAVLKEKGFWELYETTEAFVAKHKAKFTDHMKAAHADGKLTQEEAQFIFTHMKAELIAHFQAHGRDIVKEYGEAFIDALIEWVLSKLNWQSKAVAVPLSSSSDSAPLPESVTQGVMPA